MSSLALVNQITNFPREFERKSWDELDKRYYMILILSWITIYSLVTILGNINYDTGAHNAKARADYLEMIKNSLPVKILEPLEAKDEIPEDMLPGNEINTFKEQIQIKETSRVAEGQGASAVDKINTRRKQEAMRLAARKQMVQEVGQTGIIGLLNSGTSNGSGSAVLNAFDDGGGTAGDLDDVISGVDGLASADAPEQRTLIGRSGGGRVTGSADVADLLSGVGATGSTSIGRKGSILLAIESARVTGTAARATYRSSDEISKVINLHNAGIEYCFKREAKLNPNLSGEILVELIIGFNGMVKRVQIFDSSFHNSILESCMASRIRAWRFKPILRREGDVTVRQKYIFN